MNKKIGIVTVYDSTNLGSYLQALAMQELVKERGDVPFFIQTRSRFSTLCLFLGLNMAEQVSPKKILRFVLHLIKHAGKTKNKINKYRAYRRNWEKLERVVSLKKANRMNLDAVLLGSDEIWNVKQAAFRNPIMYGIGINAKKKIAYAVSAGHMDVDDWKKYPYIINAIKKLDGVFVRDEYTAKILEKNGFEVTGKMCDPTLQTDIRKHMKDYQCKKERYMVIYSYKVTQEMQEMLQSFAKEKGLITVAVSLPQDWCDVYLNCSPLEFGNILKDAEFVYTTTFHGTIFSALYHTKCVVFPAVQKVRDVAELLGIENMLIDEDCTKEKLEEILCMERDYEKVEQRILKIREDSKQKYEKYN